MLQTVNHLNGGLLPAMTLYIPGSYFQVNVLQTRRDDAAAVTEALIAHEAIRKVEFVGSASVGKVIGQLGGKHLKPVLMELGGKGPAIVLADANLEDAAQKCVAGGRQNQPFSGSGEAS